jgi:5-methylthioadenosine/S-adenosylhomocysteine deaminase
MNPVFGAATVVSDLVYSASGANVATTIVDGQLLMENRRVKSVDIKQTVAMARDLATRLAHS